MNEAVLPVGYLNTHMLCRWRFLLGDNLDSEKGLNDVLNDILKTDLASTWILTGIRDGLYVLSEVEISEVDSKTQALHLHVDEREYSEDREWLSLQGLGALSEWGVHAALAAIVAGGIEDARRGKCCGKKYAEYVNSRIKSNYEIYVNGDPYPLFESAVLLLTIITSVRCVLEERNEYFFDREYRAMCNTCPFAAHCDVPLTGGSIMKSNKYALKTGSSFAMYLDDVHGYGWYMLYRAAVRYLGYKSKNLKRAIHSAMVEVYGKDYNNIEFNTNDLKPYFEEDKKLNMIEVEELAFNAREILENGEYLVSYEHFMTSPMTKELVKRGYFQISALKEEEDEEFDDEKDNRYFVLVPGKSFLKKVWGDAID